MLFVAIVFVVCGIAAALIAVLRRSTRANAPLTVNPFEPRMTAQVAAGPEQIVLHLGRRLGIARSFDDAGYGDLYIAASSETRMRFATRSEIGRGYEAEMTIRRSRHRSTVEYFVLRLPGDEAVYERLVVFERQVVEALTVLDPRAEIRAASSTATARARLRPVLRQASRATDGARSSADR